MKQIVEQLNKIAKKIDANVDIPDSDLIIDSLDAITKAYGGTPNNSNLLVDKLEDIYNNIEPVPSGNIEITENGENINVAAYATATVNVSGGGGDEPTEIVYIPEQTVTAERIDLGGDISTIGSILNNVNLDVNSLPNKMIATINDIETTFVLDEIHTVYSPDDPSITCAIQYSYEINKWVYAELNMQVGDTDTISAVSVEDSGGGGSIPLLQVTADNDTNSSWVLGVQPLNAYENNAIVDGVFRLYAHNSDTKYYIPSIIGESNYIGFIYELSAQVTTANPVNCTVLEDTEENMCYVNIIDPTINSSIDIHITQ